MSFYSQHIFKFNFTDEHRKNGQKKQAGHKRGRLTRKAQLERVVARMVKRRTGKVAAR